ncbi:hypothetical protein I6J71_02695 [Amycolatopsis sp. FDAARGOS 1241]|nr:hypothetical protein I6J71_02695 [Amycolatopsis sp. FDAARGOS 1241]
MLEDELGATLSDRKAHARLTEEGLALLGHAETVLDCLDIARRQITALRDLDGGHLRTGAFPTAAPSSCPTRASLVRRTTRRAAKRWSRGRATNMGSSSRRVASGNEPVRRATSRSPARRWAERPSENDSSTPPKSRWKATCATSCRSGPPNSASSRVVSAPPSSPASCAAPSARTWQSCACAPTKLRARPVSVSTNNHVVSQRFRPYLAAGTKKLTATTALLHTAEGSTQENRRITGTPWLPVPSSGSPSATTPSFAAARMAAPAATPIARTVASLYSWPSCGVTTTANRSGIGLSSRNASKRGRSGVTSPSGTDGQSASGNWRLTAYPRWPSVLPTEITIASRPASHSSSVRTTSHETPATKPG